MTGIYCHICFLVNLLCGVSKTMDASSSSPFLPEDGAFTFGWMGAALIAASVALLVHHRYKHRSGGPDPLEGMNQWFQTSDVGNFRRCNHEMWILCLMAVAVTFILISLFDF